MCVLELGADVGGVVAVLAREDRVEQVERVPRGSRGARAVGASAANSAMCAPPRRPKTTMSSSELVPSRFAPCTLTQAHSPAAYRPGTGVSSGPSTTCAVGVGGDAAHRVVRGGLDGHRLRRGLDAQVHARELRDVGELLLDDLGRGGVTSRYTMSPFGPAPRPSLISW